MPSRFLGFKKRIEEYTEKHNNALGRKESYCKFLKSDYWKKKRLKVLKKNKFKCFICGGRAWQVHHKSYNNLGRESEKDLIALCGKCHKKLSEKVKNNELRLKSAHHILRREFKEESDKQDFLINALFGDIQG